MRTNITKEDYWLVWLCAQCRDIYGVFSLGVLHFHLTIILQEFIFHHNAICVGKYSHYHGGNVACVDHGLDSYFTNAVLRIANNFALMPNICARVHFYMLTYSFVGTCLCELYTCITVCICIGVHMLSQESVYLHNWIAASSCCFHCSHRAVASQCMYSQFSQADFKVKVRPKKKRKRN